MHSTGGYNKGRDKVSTGDNARNESKNRIPPTEQPSSSVDGAAMLSEIFQDNDRLMRLSDMPSGNQRADGTLSPIFDVTPEPATHRQVTAYDDLVPVAWADVPNGEPAPEPMYLSTSAAHHYLTGDGESMVSHALSDPIITPSDVSVAYQTRRTRRYASSGLFLLSLAALIASLVAQSLAIGAIGLLMFIPAFACLVLAASDTTPELLAASLSQQGQLLTLLGSESTGHALPRPQEGGDGEPDGMTDANPEGMPVSDEVDEDDALASYAESMGRRGDGLRQRLSQIKPSGTGAVALVIDEASWQAHEARTTYDVAMAAIGGKFEPNSLSWQRFAYGARTGYEQVLDNCDSVATCLESVDLEKYNGGNRYWDEHGERLDPPPPVPSPEYEATHESLLRLLAANDGIIEAMGKISRDIAGMMADEAADGTEDVTEYLQSLVDDLPEYRSEGQGASL